MSDCTVNIADFRSVHMLNAPRRQEFSRRSSNNPSQHTPSGHSTEPFRVLVEMALISKNSRVYDIARIREMRDSERSNEGSRSCRAKVLRFEYEAVKPLPQSPNYFKSQPNSEDFDPLDSPPAA